MAKVSGESPVSSARRSVQRDRLGCYPEKVTAMEKSEGVLPTTSSMNWPRASTSGMADWS